MAERIPFEGYLSQQLAEAREFQDRRRLRFLKSLVGTVARGQRQGWLTNAVTSLPTPEQLVSGRRFSGEQLQGLQAVGFTFVADAETLSLEQLYQDPSKRALFDYVTDAEQLRNIVPVARQVAVNLKQLDLPNSGSLSFDDQLELAGRAAKKLKEQSPKSGTLDGVDFGMDRVSVFCQLDFKHQAQFNGRKLFRDFFARSIDEYAHPRFGSGVALVGRDDPGDRLDVGDWVRDDGLPRLRVVLVATPSGNR